MEMLRDAIHSENVCGYKKPPFSIWRALGFRDASAPWLEDEEYPEYAISRLETNVVVVLDWADRLRLLVSGKLKVATSTKTDVAISRSVGMSNISVLPPGKYDLPNSIRRDM